MWGNTTHREGWGGIYGGGVNDNPTYTGNRQNGLTYDLGGNYTAGGAMTYDATGQQTASSASLSHAYDGDRLRGKRVDNGVVTYYLRSSVLGGQVIAELTWLNGAWVWSRGYVYLGSQMLGIQTNGVVTWVHQEPVSKGQRFTDSAGNSTGTIVEVDPWGGNTNRSVNSTFQPHLYTSYERDSDSGDDAMMRRYIANSTRFAQPDPYDGSYESTNPQSFNRYSYVNNDPVDLVDPSGLVNLPPEDVIRIYTRAPRYIDDFFLRFFLQSLFGGRRPILYPREPREHREPREPQDPEPGQQRQPGPTFEALFEKVKQECLARKKAEADQARAQYVAGFGGRIIRGMRNAAIIGGITGARAGAVAGGIFGAGVGALPGAIGGAMQGASIAAAGSVFRSVAQEPFRRMWYDHTTYNPALNKAHMDCDAEARTAVFDARFGVRR